MLAKKVRVIGQYQDPARVPNDPALDHDLTLDPHLDKDLHPDLVPVHGLDRRVIDREVHLDIRSEVEEVGAEVKATDQDLDPLEAAEVLGLAEVLTEVLLATRIDAEALLLPLGEDRLGAEEDFLLDLHPEDEEAHRFHLDAADHHPHTAAAAVQGLHLGTCCTEI